MKSHMKKQRGNAFHRGWPEAKERYLDNTLLCWLVPGVDHQCGVSHPTICPQSLSKLWLVQIGQCYVTMLQFASFIEPP